MSAADMYPPAASSSNEDLIVDLFKSFNAARQGSKLSRYSEELDQVNNLRRSFDVAVNDTKGNFGSATSSPNHKFLNHSPKEDNSLHVLNEKAEGKIEDFPITNSDNLYQQLLKEKMNMFANSAEIIHIEHELLSLYEQEAAERWKILGLFASCRPPHLCKHLFDADHSALFLEMNDENADEYVRMASKLSPSRANICIECFYSCAVQQEYYPVIQEPLLIESEKELTEIFRFYKLESIYYGVSNLVCQEEKRQMDKLMDYHRYAMKWAATWCNEAGAKEYCTLNGIGFTEVNLHTLAKADKDAAEKSDQEHAGESLRGSSDSSGNNLSIQASSILNDTLSPPAPVDTTKEMEEDDSAISERKSEEGKMQLVVVPNAQLLQSSTQDNMEDRVEMVYEIPRGIRSIQYRHNFLRKVIGEHDSPFCSYLLYLDVNIIVTSEMSDRDRIVVEENAAFDRVLWSFFYDEEQELADLESVSNYFYEMLREREKFVRKEIEEQFFRGKQTISDATQRRKRKTEKTAENERIRSAFVEKSLAQAESNAEHYLDVHSQLIREYGENLDALLVMEQYTNAEDRHTFVDNIKKKLGVEVATNVELEEHEERLHVKKDEKNEFDSLKTMVSLTNTLFREKYMLIVAPDRLFRCSISLLLSELEKREQIIKNEADSFTSLYNSIPLSKEDRAARNERKQNTEKNTKVLTADNMRDAIIADLSDFMPADEIKLLFNHTH